VGVTVSDKHSSLLWYEFITTVKSFVVQAPGFSELVGLPNICCPILVELLGVGSKLCFQILDET